MFHFLHDSGKKRTSGECLGPILHPLINLTFTALITLRCLEKKHPKKNLPTKNGIESVKKTHKKKTNISLVPKLEVLPTHLYN